MAVSRLAQMAKVAPANSLLRLGNVDHSFSSSSNAGNGTASHGHRYLEILDLQSPIALSFGTIRRSWLVTCVLGRGEEQAFGRARYTGAIIVVPGGRTGFVGAGCGLAVVVALVSVGLGLASAGNTPTSGGSRLLRSLPFLFDLGRDVKNFLSRTDLEPLSNSTRYVRLSV